MLTSVGNDIFKQLFQATPGYSAKLDVSFLSLLKITLGEITAAAAGGLNPLVMASIRREIGLIGEIGGFAATAEFDGVIFDDYG